MKISKFTQYRLQNTVSFLSIVFFLLLTLIFVLFGFIIFFITEQIKPIEILSLLINLLIFLATLFTVITAICLYDNWKIQHNHKIISKTALEALQAYDELYLKNFPVLEYLSSNVYDLSDVEFNAIEIYIDSNLIELKSYALKLDLKLTQLEFLSGITYPQNFSSILDCFQKSDHCVKKWQSLVEAIQMIAMKEENFKNFIKEHIRIK